MVCVGNGDLLDLIYSASLHYVIVLGDNAVHVGSGLGLDLLWCVNRVSCFDLSGLVAVYWPVVCRQS